ncbi:hypothetical protein [Caenispirillum salinarum]|uniref:hypothetical protein n=1 Tax=Caenispirillum salinarum TaxID=859058 RepID=UPI0005BBCB63|nr:hypothetical protein [Caenispirillum salinarum]
MTPRNATFGQHLAAVAWVIAVSLMFHGLMGLGGWQSGSAEAHTALEGELFETDDDGYRLRSLH